MASNGPPDDFHNQRTQYANYGALGGSPAPGEAPAEPPPDQPEQPEALDPFEQQPEPTPWYRKPAGIIAWIVAVLILLALIVYGLMELIQGGGHGTSPSPSTTSSTTTTTTTTTTPTTTESSAPPPTSSAAEPPAQQPTQQPTRQPTQQQPTHRHHMPQLPSVITIPDGPVVTLPPGMS
ncbi:hypothetical protein [Mycobacterium sp. 1081908.1]|uniref:hypothetical protein n=1 Tax=Mycobacterium sp. 1081908.1 TaxID=1834066 RepID=UPI0008015E66|nr:hypothetical protein [Mycobacterium sp. 1081908.1]OBK43172.1 hypothetical protein A5655_17790 [Mycobacterium sp. 1081908.1]